MDYLEDSVEKAMSNDKEVILLGDFNCNLVRTSLSDNGKRLISTLRSLGFCQLIKEPTRVTAQSATFDSYEIMKDLLVHLGCLMLA